MKESCWSTKLPQDGSLRELPAGLPSGLPPGSEQTNAARACLGPGPQLSAGRQAKSALALVQVPRYFRQGWCSRWGALAQKIISKIS